MAIYVGELFVRGIILCLLTLLVLVLLRHTAAAYRHQICVLALFGLLVLPFAQRLLPPLPLLPPPGAATPLQATLPPQEADRHSDIKPYLTVKPTPVLPQHQLHEEYHMPVAATLTPSRNSPVASGAATLNSVIHQDHAGKETVFLFAIWGIGFATLFIRLMVALLRLHALAAASQKAVVNNIPVRISKRVHTPLTWGVRRNVILLPAALTFGDPAVCASALNHEMAHVARWDWAWNLFAEIVCAVCWFQPGAWWLRQRMRLESERACDDRVLLSGISGPDYAAHLLQILRAVSTREVAPAMAQSQGMEERMRHILDTQKPRRAQTKWLAVSALFALALLSIATLRVAARPIGANRDRTLTGHSKPVYVAVFSPDSKHLLTGSADGTAIVWDVTTGENLLTLKTNAAVASVLYTPNGKFILTGCNDGAIHVWDAVTGKRLRSLSGLGGAVRALDISSDGAELLSGYDSGKVKIWKLSTGEGIGTFTYDSRLLSAAITPDGNSIAAGYHDTTMKVWDIQTQHSLLSRKISRNTGVTRMVFDRNNTLYTWGRETAKDGKSNVTAMTMWELEAMKKGGPVILGIITFPNTANTISHAISYDTFTMLFGLSGGQAILNNMHDGPVTLDAHEGPVAAVAISPDGTWAATGGKRNGKGEAKLWVIKAHRPANPADTKQ